MRSLTLALLLALSAFGCQGLQPRAGGGETATVQEGWLSALLSTDPTLAPLHDQAGALRLQLGRGRAGGMQTISGGSSSPPGGEMRD